MKVLFDSHGNPLGPTAIRQSVLSFGDRYNGVVQKVIEKTHVKKKMGT